MLTATVQGLSPLDTTVAVETPEHIRFDQHLAGPTLRGFAYLVDLVIRGLAFCVFVVVTHVAGASAALGETWDGSVAGLSLVVLFGLEWGYFAVFESLWNGQTPGKRLLGIRVVRLHGEASSYRDAILRNLLRGADVLPWGYAIGLAWMCGDRRFRRLGDLVAGTVVVLVRQDPWADHRSTGPGIDEQLWASLPPRPVLRPQQAAALDHFARRQAQLSPERACEVADIIAPRLARSMGVQYKDPAQFLVALHARYRQSVRTLMPVRDRITRHEVRDAH